MAFFIHRHNDRDSLAFGHPFVFPQGILRNGGGQVRAFRIQVVQKLLVRFRRPVKAGQRFLHLALGVPRAPDFLLHIRFRGFQAFHQLQLGGFQGVNGGFRLLHLLNAHLVFLVFPGVGLEGFHLADVGALGFNGGFHVPYALLNARDFLLGGQGLLLDGLHLAQQARSLFRQGGQLLPEFGDPHIFFLKDQQLV